MTVDLAEGMGSDVYLHYRPSASGRHRGHAELASDIDEKALTDLKEQASERRTSFITRAGPDENEVRRAGEMHVDTRKLSSSIRRPDDRSRVTRPGPTRVRASRSRKQA